jgi:hypothetical protein
MGLDTSHNAWHGGYGLFNQWREWIAEQIGIPLELMEGHYIIDGFPNLFSLLQYDYPLGNEAVMRRVRKLQKQLPLKWTVFKPNPLHILLYHSDCDGYINWRDCGKIAKGLQNILNKVDEEIKISQTPDIAKATCEYNYNKTKQFIEGCTLAFTNKEKLEFH